MYKKVLIANRGEIALRVIRACRELGIKSLPVHSSVDAHALHVRFADEEVCSGFPIIIEASAGGGGRRMKSVESRDRLRAQLAAARSEGQAGFGNPDVYLERYIERPRHVEVQVLGDGTRAISLGERECSIQRRHQKLVEEAPSVALDDTRRAELLAVARSATKSLGYRTRRTPDP